MNTNVGVLPYLLDDGEDAPLVPVDDCQAMAAAVRRILTKQGLSEKLSINARQKAERFDLSLILPKWEFMFRKIAND